MKGAEADYYKLEIEWLPPILFSIDVCVMLIAIFLVSKMSYTKQS
jgi:hypothetical protein